MDEKKRDETLEKTLEEVKAEETPQVKKELTEEEIIANINKVNEIIEKSGAVFLSICVIPQTGRLNWIIPHDLKVTGDLINKLNAVITNITLMSLRPPQERIVRAEPNWRQKLTAGMRNFVMGKK